MHISTDDAFLRDMPKYVVIKTPDTAAAAKFTKTKSQRMCKLRIKKNTI
jgi:hypothetical protein